jgi:hypothetical protein
VCPGIWIREIGLFRLMMDSRCTAFPFGFRFGHLTIVHGITRSGIRSHFRFAFLKLAPRCQTRSSNYNCPPVWCVGTGPLSLSVSVPRDLSDRARNLSEYMPRVFAFRGADMAPLISRLEKQ